MKVNNSELISLLFNEPELVKALNQVIPYISVFKEKTILNIRCLEVSSLASLLKFRSHLTNKLIPLLGYEIHLECIQNAIGETGMVAVAERTSIEVASDSRVEARLLSLDTLARATAKTPTDVKKLLGIAREVIHLTEDGVEMITEAAFNSVVLQWAKSFKDDSQRVGDGSTDEITGAITPTSKPPKPSSSRRAKAKILASKLTFEDIIKTKTGKKANTPNLTQKGVQETLENFFKKVNMQDTSNIDAISAFIEGTSEFGISLRKELLSAYELFTKEPNIQELQEKLVEGAKVMLEGIATENIATVANSG